ncbi:penicillin-binding transpeptidase domain-containing protein [Nocardiopsis changdeensis]|uniref:penicillin-binding transpeptidase domain-containing protein n=1 Tax=Nocardiopsis changdeensis TaxID=2831969 RepID=UPI003F47CEE7
MDERSPRQPDSSGPPEESGDTPTRGVRPENPYRIPQRPPAPGGTAAGGPSDRPESWDTPYPAAQGPTGEWTPPRPEETPPTDTWKDWQAPSEEPEAAPDRDADGPERTTAAWDATGGAPAPDERPTGTHRGTGPAWDDRPGAAPATDDSWDGGDQSDSWGETHSGPQQTNAGWGERPGDTRGTSDGWNTQSGPQQTGAAWSDPGDDAPAWGEQSGSTRGSDNGSSGSPQATAGWGEARSANDGWDAHSGPQQTAAAWSGPGDAPGWGEQPANTRGSNDTWDDSDQGNSWGDSNSGPQQTNAAWTGSGDVPGWGEQPRDARGANDDWNAQSDPQQTGAAWSDPDNSRGSDNTWDDSDQGNSWGDGNSGPQQTAAAWNGPGDDAPAWDEQPRDAHGSNDGWGEAHSGPQQTAAGWGEQPRDTRGANDGWDAHSGPQQTAAAWSGSGDDAPGWGEQPPGAGGTGPRTAEPGHGDRWSGPQQGAGDGRGGPPPGPGGPRDGWDDWDGEPRDAESAPRGDGFEYLYHGNAAAPPEQPDRQPRKSKRGLVIGLIAAGVVLALIGGGVSWYVLTLPQPEEAVEEYAAAWEAQDYERLAAVTTGGGAAEVLGGIASGIGVESVDVTVGEPTADGGTGTASYEVAVGLSNAGDWGWEGELPLVRQDGEWLVDFSPEVAFPGLAEGQTLARTAVWGERGQILAADGTRLDTPDVSGSLQMIVGGMGEATEEDIERLGPAYRVGDTVGTSGLQRTYEERLAGQAATTIVMVDAGTEADAVEATEENTVASLDGAPGENVVTSIDMAVQNAAANAIIDSDDPAGMVAIRPSTGEILAAVNVPGGFNRAFEGRYPPGSTFKVVSYNALLDGGLTMDSQFQCPKEYNPGGWEFTNAGGAEYGAQTMTQAFATSCNTALVQAAVDNIDANALLASAELFGMNAPMDIGVPTFEPVYPLSEGAVMLGAQAIGQGQVETSALHMATVPAAVADGNWRPPLLVTEPAAEAPAEPRPIPNAEALRTMMRAVITEGTAENLPFQGEVYGKTGTAEFGTAEGEDEELPSHAWMVGFKGDVAFAVVVEGGGGGSSVAGPIAAKFTNAL